MLIRHSKACQQCHALVMLTACTALAELWWTPRLLWRSVPGEPGEPRCRHAAAGLGVLQQQPWEAMGALPCLSGAVLLFGGVRGLEWLSDLEVVTLLGDRQGGVRVVAQPVVLAPGSSPGPAPLRDFAACACGHSQLLVVGGLTGSGEVLDMHMCEVVACSSGSAAGGGGSSLGTTGAGRGAAVAGAAGADAEAATCGEGSGGLPRQWAVHWSRVLPRNAALPPARSHHSQAMHPEGRSLVMFGGYSSHAGCLNDLWLFHLDHLEWWQPETTGM